MKSFSSSTHWLKYWCYSLLFPGKEWPSQYFVFSGRNEVMRGSKQWQYSDFWVNYFFNLTWAVEVAEPALFPPHAMCVWELYKAGHSAEESVWLPEWGHLSEQQAVGTDSRAPSFRLMEALCAHTNAHTFTSLKLRQRLPH